MIFDLKTELIYSSVESKCVRGVLRTSCKAFNRNSRIEMFLGKGVLKICNKFAGEHLCRSAILLKSHIRMGALL